MREAIAAKAEADETGRELAERCAAWAASGAATTSAGGGGRKKRGGGRGGVGHGNNHAQAELRKQVEVEPGTAR